MLLKLRNAVYVKYEVILLDKKGLRTHVQKGRARPLYNESVVGILSKALASAAQLITDNDYVFFIKIRDVKTKNIIYDSGAIPTRQTSSNTLLDYLS